ncbi:MAG TPA: ATP-binding protein [Nitriliruptorales bacterium]|nr:ATP-binding protein [Nitriliruptorales bacterium]
MNEEEVQRTQEFLRTLPYFADMPPDRLEQLCRSVRYRTVPAGELLLAEGSPSHAMYVVAEGEFEITRRSAEGEVPVARTAVGAPLGEISLLDGTERGASARALVDSRVVEIGRDLFDELLSEPATIQPMLRTVVARLRHTEATLREREKMAALGTLAAGLLHELNNPAAAARRSAARLAEVIGEWMAAARPDGGDEPSTPTARLAPPSDPLTRADRHDEVGGWLAAHGVDADPDLVAALVSHGWDGAALDELAAAREGGDLAGVVRWVGLGTTVEELVREVRTATERISELVAAVKSYSYLGEAPVQNVDVHRGLDDTLLILRSELEPGVEVVRKYADDLPRIEAYGSELNQVWTNLIDNAIDAMEGHGRLVVRTSRDGDRVAVEISDTGPGVPEQVASRIFEPFFTTKAPGSGTGQGLHIAYSIVARHGGQLTLSSRPGATTFRVTLPVELPPRPAQRSGGGDRGPTAALPTAAAQPAEPLGGPAGDAP